MSKRMKKSSMALNVLVALAMMLSFAVASVGADVEPMDVTEPEVTVDPALEGEAAEYFIQFETSTRITSGGSIYVGFPAGTVVPDPMDADEVVVWVNGSEVDVDSVTVDGQEVSIAVADPVETDSWVSVTFSVDAGIENPPEGTYNLNVWTSAEPNPVESEEYEISATGPVDVFEADETYIDSYDTIQEGVDVVPVDGYVRVMAGTYPEKVEIATEGVTVESYDGADVTIIDAEDVENGDGWLVDIISDSVTFQGFTVQNASEEEVYLDAEAEGPSLAGSHGWEGGIGVAEAWDVALLDNMVLDNAIGIGAWAGNLTVQGNVVSGNVIGLVGELYAPTIVDNVVNGNAWAGAWIWVEGESLIEGNAFSNNGAGAEIGGLESLGLANNEEPEEWGLGLAVLAGEGMFESVDIATNGPVAGVEIIDNTIEDNVGLGLGLLGPGTFDVQRNVIGGNVVGIGAAVGGATANIHYNDIAGNAMYGLYHAEGAVNAEYNWWNCVGGPSGIGMGNGDAIVSEMDADVPYDPWLTKDQDTVVSSGISWFGSLLELDEAGWNTASVPVDLNPDGDTLADIVAMGTFVRDEDMESFIEAAWWYDAEAGYWRAPELDTKLVPGLGMYVKTTQPISIPVLYSGTFGAAPSRSLEEGWNLVGSMFGVEKTGYSVNNGGTMTVEDALASVEDEAKNIISPSLAGQTAAWSDVYPATKKNMVVGEAYWVWMADAANLAGLEVTPFAELPGLID